MQVTRCDRCKQELGSTDFHRYPWYEIFSFHGDELCLLCLADVVNDEVRKIMQRFSERTMPADVAADPYRSRSYNQ